MTTEAVSNDLRAVLRRLKLSRLMDTLPERLVLARQQKMAHQDFLTLLLADEISRRDSQGAVLRAQRARIDPQAQLENWDDTAKVSFDRQLLSEIVTLRFLEAHRHVAIYGPVGVGKTFWAHAIGHVACRRGFSVMALRCDRMLKTLKQARLIGAYEVELRKLIAVDLLIIDDFCLDAMDQQESRDTYDVLVERDRSGSIIITSNRGPDEWLATFYDPLRAQSAIDRFVSNAFDLLIEGESYRNRLKPKVESSSDNKSNAIT
jgi:DNA replication protein DnaC